MKRACYRSLKRYKYQLMEDYEVKLPTLSPRWPPQGTPLLHLDNEGTLSIRKGYCWDGPSGPTWDTPNSMRGALVHDALYQLLRDRMHSVANRRQADQVFRSILLEDGMSRIRAWVWYRSVRRYASWAAKAGTQEPAKLLHAPPHRKVKTRA